MQTATTKRYSKMTRAATKLLLAAFTLGGVLVAADSGLFAGTGDLPTPPVTTSRVTAMSPAGTDNNLVVDLTNWQETRIIIGKSSNVIPTPRP